ncbi:MAG TPA: tripartite tricarboxylate transporter substrate binding protein [Burkholderiales bacterium]|nr:tripartite tricarboxylate transporter substrate binding protein [Burkholderiales bacterium]
MKFSFYVPPLSLLIAAGVHAQTAYPTKPVRIIVPFPPGGPTDTVTRIIGPKLSEALSHQIIIDNRGGAGGATGTELVAKSTPDGYTILAGTIGGLAVSPTLNPRLGYNTLRDLAPITQLVNVAYIVTLHPSVPAKSMQELIALARARPGKLNYGTSGAGTGPHLAGELLNMMAGINIVHIPYKGSAPAQTALMSGEVDITFENTLIILPQVKSGRLRPIAATGSQRSKLMPDLPTVAESGLPGFSASGWYGMLAPIATPKDIILKLNTEITRVLRMPDIADRLNALAAEPAPGAPEQFSAFIRSEIDKWAKVVKAANMKAE